MHQEASHGEVCMICGSRHQLLWEGELVLCARCVEGLGQALEAHLPDHGLGKKEKEGIEKPLLLW